MLHAPQNNSRLLSGSNHDGLDRLLLLAHLRDRHAQSCLAVLFIKRYTIINRLTSISSALHGYFRSKACSTSG